MKIRINVCVCEKRRKCVRIPSMLLNVAAL